MNFSWVIPLQLAGSMGPVLDGELLYLRRRGVKPIVRLERSTVSGEQSGLIDMAEYVPDFQAPSLHQIDRIVPFIRRQIENDSSVVVSCRAGQGRTGTVLACYLMHEGYSAEGALESVRRLRPGSVESPLQQEFIYRYGDRLEQASV